MKKVGSPTYPVVARVQSTGRRERVAKFSAFPPNGATDGQRDGDDDERRGKVL